MTISSVDWISRYTIAQRLSASFTDGRNVFLLGDACHTHSPEAGLGMNIGMQDVYNLT
jgi:phenol 2-monooxygenase (NADPH)